MLERMDVFFNKKAKKYDQTVKENIPYTDLFYHFTALKLPANENSRILNLGCGTGIELEEYFAICPTAKVTAVDLSKKMLNELKKKFKDKNKDITYILGSFFDVDFGKDAFDAAVSVQSLHYYTKEQKIPLYAKVHKSLAKDGYFIITDYFSLTNEEEKICYENFLRFRNEQGIKDEKPYHFDIPLTVEHEAEALRRAGFSSVQILNKWGRVYTLKANK